MSKRLARAVALVGKQARTAGATAAMTGDTGPGCRGELLGQLLPLQLFHTGANRLEIVSCSGFRHRTLPGLALTCVIAVRQSPKRFQAARIPHPMPLRNSVRNPADSQGTRKVGGLVSLRAEVP